MKSEAYFTRLFALALVSMGLTLSGCQQIEKSEAETAATEVAMMQGRDAARRLMANRWNDTVAMRTAAAKAREPRERYVKAKQPRRAEAFDSGFVRTIRSVDLRMYKAIQYPDSTVPADPERR